MDHLVKALIDRMFSRPPRRARAAARVFIRRPRLVEGAQHMSFDERVVIASHAWIAAYDRYDSHRYSPSLRVGARTQIGRYSCITCINRIDIGQNCLFSEHVYISDHAHGFMPDDGPPARQPLHSKGPVVIGDNCFVGYRAVILPGVTLGKNCVVGANSVVTRSFPAFSMVAGVPAKLIKTYSESDRQWVDA
jgi:acetyltransferase-like isoleucine patch superfamily enzyme